MIVDSSALCAILLYEPEAYRLTTAIAKSSVCWLPSPCFLETSMLLLGRRGEEGLRDLEQYIARSRIEIASFTESHARLAREAFKRFGKGRHPAALNFGDCIADALAKETGEELLFKGDEFAQTDVAAAPY